MKNLTHNFGAIALTLALIGNTASLRAGTTYLFITPNSSLLKSGNYTNTATSAASGVPGAGDIGEISQPGGTGPVGWNNNTNPGATIYGAIDLLPGATNLVFGDYTTKTSNINVNITLSATTINSLANTVIANGSGSTVLFQNDVVPSGDDATETGLTTYTLTAATNVIQATTAAGNIIIDNVIAGSGAGVTFDGGGSSNAAGATLELGAGSANDVAGGAAANAPVPANTGFTGKGTVQTADTNSFTGGLTIGAADGTQAGIVKVDGGNALPTTGAVTVNPFSQLILNGSATYGGTAQTVSLNGTGTGTGTGMSTTNGALTTGTSDTSTLQAAVSLPVTSAINVQGASSLTISGAITGSGQLDSTGTGRLTLSNANNYSGGTSISNGSFVAANAGALGTGAVSVSGGVLSSSAATATVGGALSLGNTGTIALSVSALPTLTLTSGSNFTMSGGTLSLTYDLVTAGSIASAGGTFSITGGTFNLNNSFTTPLAYAGQYDVLTGFTPGTVANLTFTNYDTADYTAHFSDLGVLSFTSNSAAVPEPGTWALLVGGCALLIVTRVSRRNQIS